MKAITVVILVVISLSTLSVEVSAWSPCYPGTPPCSQCNQDIHAGQAMTATKVQDPDAVCINTNATFSAKACDIDQCGDPQDCENYSFNYHWYIDDLEQPEISYNITRQWASPGIHTVNCIVEDASTGFAKDANVPLNFDTIAVIGGGYTTDRVDLRYYCGVYASGAVLRSVPNQPQGTSYLWTVTSGPGMIQTGATEYSCFVRATGPSDDYHDIKIKLTYSYGGYSCDYTTYGLTSYEPISADYIETQDTCDMLGYISFVIYKVLDQNGIQMLSFPVAETFEDDRIDDWPLNNWNSPEPGGSGNTDYWCDGIESTYAFYTLPTVDCLYDDSVFGHTQHLFVGTSVCDGTGCLVKTVWQHYYRNRGRHE